MTDIYLHHNASREAGLRIALLASVLRRRTSFNLLRLFLVLLLTHLCWGEDVCPRFQPGSRVQNPPNLFSSDGQLTVDLTYQSEVDNHGLTRFCFTTPHGKQSPTLHVKPGDELILRVKNLVPENAHGLPLMKMKPMPGMEISPGSGASGIVCGSATMTSASVNVHYHGANVSPTCHADEVIRTMINSGESFTYRIHFPNNEPAGLYWYHPHIHGIAEAAVQGGATGLIVVSGFEKIQPLVGGLKQRFLVVRDQPVAGNGGDGSQPPAWDVSLNYVPVLYPDYVPAVIGMSAGEKQFWRVANTAADTILDLEVRYDDVPQTVMLVALDGVPTGSQDGTRQGKALPVTHMRIPPAGRAEFIVTGPSKNVKSAVLATRKVNTGPDGDSNPERTLALLETRDAGSEDALVMPQPSGLPGRQRFEGLADAAPTQERTLYFSQNRSLNQFFVTVYGETPKVFDPNDPPAIVTQQGSVEDWTIENHTPQNHEFHIHQIHFLLLEKNGVPVPEDQQQFLDTIDVPFWSGSGPYPSVKVRMDFRGPDVGDFVYHCHILLHEDNGMMAIIRVLPNTTSAVHSEGNKAWASDRIVPPTAPVFPSR